MKGASFWVIVFGSNRALSPPTIDMLCFLAVGHIHLWTFNSSLESIQLPSQRRIRPVERNLNYLHCTRIVYISFSLTYINSHSDVLRKVRTGSGPEESQLAMFGEWNQLEIRKKNQPLLRKRTTSRVHWQQWKASWRRRQTWTSTWQWSPEPRNELGHSALRMTTATRAADDRQMGSCADRRSIPGPCPVGCRLHVKQRHQFCLESCQLNWIAGSSWRQIVGRPSAEASEVIRWLIGGTNASRHSTIKMCCIFQRQSTVILTDVWRSSFWWKREMALKPQTVAMMNIKAS